MAGVSQLGYLGLSVGDGEAWREFATRILGFGVSEDSDDQVIYLRMDDYHHRFVLHTRGDDDLAYIGWQVPDEWTLEAIGERLTRAGVNVADGAPGETKLRRVLRLIKFDDPSGIPTEVFCGPQVTGPGFSPTRQVSGFRTGTLGAGHLVVHQPDQQESVRFYCDLLGFRVTDYVRMSTPVGDRSMVFLHCNPRHHSIAFTQRQQAKRLHHLMVECNALDDVGFTYDACRKGAAPVGVGLGRHINDQMFSFFLVTPSGFLVEYGWGGRDVDDSIWQVRHYSSGASWGHEGLGEVQPRPALAGAGQGTY